MKTIDTAAIYIMMLNSLSSLLSLFPIHKDNTVYYSDRFSLLYSLPCSHPSLYAYTKKAVRSYTTMIDFSLSILYTTILHSNANFIIIVIFISTIISTIIIIIVIMDITIHKPIFQISQTEVMENPKNLDSSMKTASFSQF